MYPDKVKALPNRKRSRGWIVMLITLAALLIDVDLNQILKVQLSQREQARSRQWTTYTYPTPIPQNKSYWRVFLVDALGRVWVSTPADAEASMLSMLKPDGTWLTYTPHNSALPPENILALASDEMGRIAIMTSGGISILAPDGTWTSLIKNDLPPLFMVTTTIPTPVEHYSMAFGAQGEIWLTDLVGEIYMFSRDGTWVRYDKHVSGSQLAVDKQDTVWIGGGCAGCDSLPNLGKLNRDGDWTLLTIPRDGIQDITIDKKGRLWVATALNGLVRVEPSGKWTSYTDLLSTPFLYPYFLHYTFGSPNDETLKARRVIIDSRGNVWFTGVDYRWGVYENLYTGQLMNDLSKLSGSGRLITYSSLSAGLPDVNDRIIGLGVDTRDRIWIGHYSGITVFDETSPFQTRTDLYTELVNLSAGRFWTQIIGMGLGLVSIFSFLSARAITNRASILSFIAGFLGWFMFNSINRYFDHIAVFINHLCLVYESGYPQCDFSLGLLLFFVLLNIGISVLLFKTMRLWEMGGFLVAFVINTIFHATLGHFVMRSDIFNILLPFFLRFPIDLR